jgi:hypothetical protein
LTALLAATFAAGLLAGLVTDFAAAVLALALRATNDAVTGRAPRVVVAGTRRAVFDTGFFACVRALLCAEALLAAFLPFLREALAGRRAVLVDCVLIQTI